MVVSGGTFLPEGHLIGEVFSSVASYSVYGMVHSLQQPSKNPSASLSLAIILRGGS